ncbi:hypothetical protein KEG38_43185 [Polyangium jinanense]|nr:hypothetical protein [Polyangium jinanense]
MNDSKGVVLVLAANSASVIRGHGIVAGAPHVPPSRPAINVLFFASIALSGPLANGTITPANTLNHCWPAVVIAQKTDST